MDVSNEPELRSARALLGPLAGLARELVSPGTGEDGATAALLRGLAEGLGARAVEWHPGGPDVPAVGEARADPRTVDWGLARAVAPGRSLVVGAEERRRSPRLAAGEGFEVLVAPTADHLSGFLRIAADRPLALREDELLALADLVAGLARRSAERQASVVERRERSAGRRLATIAHDLRNQLTLSLLQLERIEAPRSADVAPEAAPDASGLRAVLEGARDLCHDTLAGVDRAPVRSPLLLRSVLVEESRAAASFARDARRVRTLVRCPTRLRVHADLATLARLVRNLLSNAIEASIDGGEVRAEAAATPDGEVALMVADEGRGMAEAELEALFAAGTTGGAGTGYGTASLLGALEALGAELTIETAPGRGTRARVLLPGVPDEDRASALVLCDAGRRFRAWASALGAAGLGVHRARTAAEALAILRRVPTDLVVMARGTCDRDRARLEGLLEHCARSGVRVLVASALDGTAERQAERIAGLAGAG